MNEAGSISQKVHEIAQKFQQHRVPMTFLDQITLVLFAYVQVFGSMSPISGSMNQAPLQGPICRPPDHPISLGFEIFAPNCSDMAILKVYYNFDG